jgi:hypothetical protein
VEVSENTPEEVTDEERVRAWEQFREEMEARAAEGPEALAEFFETVAATIRLITLPPEAWATLLLAPYMSQSSGEGEPGSGAEGVEEARPQESAQEPAPQEPQQEVKTESVRERIFSPRSASSRARGKSLRDIIGVS